MTILKNIGSFMLGIVIFGAILFVAVFLIRGGANIADKIYPFVHYIGSIVLIIDIVILLPLSFIKKTREVAAIGFLISSYIFGLGMWLYSFIITYSLWGGLAVFIGVIMMGVGVMPIALIASLFNGLWIFVLGLLFGLFLVYGSRSLAHYLNSMVQDSTTM